MGAVVDGAADAGEQGGLGEWFFQEVDLAGEGTVGVQDRLGVPGHVQDGQGRADGADPPGHFVAEHLGHDHVGEQQVDELPGLPGDAGRLRGCRGGADVVPVAGQDAAGQLPQAGFVFDEQDRLAAAAGGRGGRCRGAGRFLAGGGQQAGDGGAEARFGVDLGVAAGSGDDAVDRRQAEPGALARSLVVKNGSNTWASTSGGMPAPVSETRSRA